MNTMAKVILGVFAGLGLIMLHAIMSHAQTPPSHTWTDWTDGTVTPAKVNGTVNGVTVTFTSTGPILTPQLGAATDPNYWQAFPATYMGGPVTNPPTTSDAVRIQGPGTYTITFSQPVTDPVMGILSLGGGLLTVTLDFKTQPVVLLKTGPGFWAVGTPLKVVGNTVVGQEGNGLIQFPGTFTTLTFSSNVLENWWGITVGIPTASNAIPVTPPVIIPPVVIPPIIGPPVVPPPVVIPPLVIPPVVAPPVVIPPVPVPPVPIKMVSLILSWQHTGPTANTPLTGFHIMRGIGTECADLTTPLSVIAGTSAWPVVSLVDAAVPAIPGPVCYEVRAFNDFGNSDPSNRAQTILVGVSAPAAPALLSVTSK